MKIVIVFIDGTKIEYARRYCTTYLHGGFVSVWKQDDLDHPVDIYPQHRIWKITETFDKPEVTKQ